MGYQDDAAAKSDVDRRSFLGSLGWLGVSISGLIAVVGNLLYLKPTVSYGPASRIVAGKPADFTVGAREVFENAQFALVREQDGFAAISLVCTHLRCTVRTSEAGFECPCHGSQYDRNGSITGGPAPEPLDWYKVGITPNGELEIDKTVKVSQGTYFNI